MAEEAVIYRSDHVLEYPYVRSVGPVVGAFLTALRDGKPPDYSRGFASRPQLRGSAELAGTEYEDGWGAHCYVQHAVAADNDKSFASWTCAEGLACQAMGASRPAGSPLFLPAAP